MLANPTAAPPRPAAVATALPRGSDDIVGAALAVVTAVVLFGQGVDAVVVTDANGAGAPFSLAVAALLPAAFFGRQPAGGCAVRSLRPGRQLRPRTPAPAATSWHRYRRRTARPSRRLSLIHISEPTRLRRISYAV